MDARILLDEEITPDGDRLVRALLVLTGSAPDDARRTPLNLALVLDRSGSMSGAPLAAAKKAAAGLVRRLSPKDVVGVVAYDDGVTTVAEPATGDAQADLAQRIESIMTGGTTNLSGGWLRGREMVDGGARSGASRVNRVILLTDGLANVGITDPQQLTGLTAQAARAGVTTTTIGFGEGFNEDLLRAMADAGGGATYYIEATDQASDVFAEELAGLLSIAAQNVRVEVAPAGAWVEGMAVRHDFPATAAGSTLTVSVGDLYAREPRRVLVQALVRMPDADESIAVFGVVVHADVVAADGSIEHRTVTMPVTVSRSGPAVSVEVRREALLLEAAEARRRAREAERGGDIDGARGVLRDVSRRIVAEAPASDTELREQADDLTLMEERLASYGTFDRSDVKYMKQREYDSMRSKRAMMDKVSRVRREKRPEA